jgi:hypothetical protein
MELIREEVESFTLMKTQVEDFSLYLILCTCMSLNQEVCYMDS